MVAHWDDVVRECAESPLFSDLPPQAYEDVWAEVCGAVDTHINAQQALTIPGLGRLCFMTDGSSHRLELIARDGSGMLRTKREGSRTARQFEAGGDARGAISVRARSMFHPDPKFLRRHGLVAADARLKADGNNIPRDLPLVSIGRRVGLPRSAVASALREIVEKMGSLASTGRGFRVPLGTVSELRASSKGAVSFRCGQQMPEMSSSSYAAREGGYEVPGGAGYGGRPGSAMSNGSVGSLGSLRPSSGFGSRRGSSSRPASRASSARGARDDRKDLDVGNDAHSASFASDEEVGFHGAGNNDYSYDYSAGGSAVKPAGARQGVRFAATPRPSTAASSLAGSITSVGGTRYRMAPTEHNLRVAAGHDATGISAAGGSMIDRYLGASNASTMNHRRPSSSSSSVRRVGSTRKNYQNEERGSRHRGGGQTAQIRVREDHVGDSDENALFDIREMNPEAKQRLMSVRAKQRAVADVAYARYEQAMARQANELRAADSLVTEGKGSILPSTSGAKTSTGGLDEKERVLSDRQRRVQYREELRAQIERNAGRRARSRLGRLAADIDPEQSAIGVGGLPPGDPLAERERRLASIGALRGALDDQIAAHEDRRREEKEREIAEGKMANEMAGESLRREMEAELARKRAVGRDLRGEWDRQASFKRAHGDLPPVQPQYTGPTGALLSR